MADKKETLALLANRIFEKCVGKADNPNIIKHGCCIHFIETVYNEFHNGAMMSGGTTVSPSALKPIPTVAVNRSTHLVAVQKIN